MEMSLNPALELLDLTMAFGTNTVLEGVNLQVNAGEIHGLVGHNGSGKSTLIKIVTGYHAPRGGQLKASGKSIDLPVASISSIGIAVVHQDLALLEELTVVENLGIGVNFDRKGIRPINWRAQERLAQELLKRVGLQLDVRALVKTLGPAERASIAIARALRSLERSSHAGVLILDEPTAYFSEADFQRLTVILQNLAESGTAVVFVSHKLHEVLSVTNRVSVLRSGKLVSTLDIKAITKDELAELMLGYNLGSFYPDIGEFDAKAEEPLLEVEGLVGGLMKTASFSVSRGEIVGVTGLAGMGHEDVPYLVAGAYSRSAGQITIHGKIVDPTPSRLLPQGIALVPGNRTRDGQWAEGNLIENFTAPALRDYSRFGKLSRRRERLETSRAVSLFNVNPPSLMNMIGSLSGGNQQKLILARWLLQSPTSMLLLHEPTQGVDAGAKKDILSSIAEAARSGRGVLISSSDYDELAHVCDRILVFSEGRIVGGMSKPISVENILSLAYLGESTSRPSIEMSAP